MGPDAGGGLPLESAGLFHPCRSPARALGNRAPWSARRREEGLANLTNLTNQLQNAPELFAGGLNAFRRLLGNDQALLNPR
jgi:hypothetical protein